MSEPAPVPASIQSGHSRIALWRSAVFAAAAVAVVIICLTGENPNSPTQAGVRMQLPDAVGRFWGYRQEVTEAEKTILPADTQFERRMYESMTGESVNCQIVLSGGAKRSIHRPEICLPGQGWTIRTGRTIPVKLDSGKELDVMKLDLVRQVPVGPNDVRDVRSVFLYWFVGKDVSTASHLRRVLLNSYDRVFHNLNHRWAYVVVSAPVTEDFAAYGRNEDQTVELLQEFIRKVVPTFQLSEMDSEA